MRNRLKQFQLYILMMFFWIVLNGKADLKVIIYGTVFSVLVMTLTNHVIFELDDNMIQLPPAWRFIWFGGIVLIAIISSSFRQVIRIVKQEQAYETFEVQLDTNNIIIITLIANAITMTPGTITLDVEGSTLSVVGFCLNEDDIEKMREEIIGYQKPFLYRRL